MRLKNTSRVSWPSSGRNPVHLSYKWRLQDGRAVEEDGLRTYLPDDILPGTNFIVPLLVRTPKEPGNLVLVLVVSLVEEQVAWFVDQDPAAACHLPIVVGRGTDPGSTNHR